MFLKLYNQSTGNSSNNIKMFSNHTVFCNLQTVLFTFFWVGERGAIFFQVVEHQQNTIIITTKVLSNKLSIIVYRCVLTICILKQFTAN